MSFSIQTNVASMIAQENLRVNGDFQSRTIQRLTSGYRINQSGDDAAGLAVANSFRSSISELTQGVRNANDGVSQLQIVDGGLNNIAQILDRLKTLATQSASDTFTGDKNVLNNEYQKLLTELDRQADNIGLGVNNAANVKNIQVYIGGGQNSSSNAAVSVDLTGSAVGQVGLGLNNTGVGGAAPTKIGTGAAVALAAGDTETFTVATATGEHVITITGKANDTLSSQVQDLSSQLSQYGISAKLDTSGVLNFYSSSAFSVLTAAGGSNTGGPLADDGAKSQNTGLYYTAFSAGKIWLNSSTSATLVAPTHTTDAGDASAINDQLKSQGITDIVAVADEVNGGVSLQSAVSTFKGVGATYAAAAAVTTGSTVGQGGGDAKIAINAITAAVKSLGLISGKIGSGQNSLNYAINLAQSQISNFSAAESRIRDADVAAEAANLTKAQVLQQASLAAMAQANSAPQAVLALLRG